MTSLAILDALELDRKAHFQTRKDGVVTDVRRSKSVWWWWATPLGSQREIAVALSSLLAVVPAEVAA